MASSVQSIQSKYLNTQQKPDILTLNDWVYEAISGHREWRKMSWEDVEMKDGAQWTQQEWDDAKNAGIDPLTVNRIFPIWSLIRGVYAKNRTDIVAKGRTHKDGEASQTMTEAIRYVLDQNDGRLNEARAFDDMISAGFGCLSVGLEPDPRKTHKIKVDYRDWKDIWWDTFSDPWMYPNQCRYVFHKPWMDLINLCALFPDKEKDIRAKYADTSGMVQHMRGSNHYDDEAYMIEERRRMLSATNWVNAKRQRVSPCEMWYTTYEKASFAIFMDGRVVEFKIGKTPPLDMMALAKNAVEIVTAKAHKMNVCTFIGDLEISNRKTPHGHDEYPFVPFIGYMDRFAQPYGIPRQIKGQNKEINKRRSMILAMLKSRRAILEEGIVDSPSDLQTLHEEVQKLDGWVVVKDGKMDKIQIIENMDRANIQQNVLTQSESEIQEISGGNAESAGYGSNITSKVGQDVKIERSSMMLSPLMENLAISQKRLGELIMNGVQNKWKKPMYLRVTDRDMNTDRFMIINEQIRNQSTGQIEVKNDITQGRFDVVVAEAVPTDTVREQYLNLVIEWVKKSPPEVIPQLMNVAFELSNLPNKEQLLAKLKPILGIDPEEENLSPEQLKAKVLKELEAQRQLQAKKKEKEDTVIDLNIYKLKLEAKGQQLLNKYQEVKTHQLLSENPANISKKYSDVKVQEMKADTDRKKLNLEAFKVGATMPPKDKLNSLKKYQAELNRQSA